MQVKPRIGSVARRSKDQSGILTAWGFIAMEIRPSPPNRPTVCILLCDNVEQENGRLDLKGVEWSSYASNFPRLGLCWAYVRLMVPFSQSGTEHTWRVAINHDDLGEIASSQPTTVVPKREREGEPARVSAWCDFGNQNVVFPNPGRYTISVYWDGTLAGALGVELLQV